MRVVVLTCALLALTTFAVYWRVRHNGFINFDDNVYITENGRVLNGLTWPDIKWAYAENRQFDKAIETAQRGSELAVKQGNYTSANVVESNIDLYRRNIPLRDTGE